jgi:hypothetical protein
MSIPVIAGLSIGILLIVIFALVSFNSSSKSTFSELSSDDAIRIVENDLKRVTEEIGSKYGVDYVIITGIAVDVPKFANYTPSYVPFEEFKEKHMKLPLVYVSSNDTVIHILENGSSQHIGQCHTGLLTYCGYRPPFELGYKGRLIYGVEMLVSSDDNMKTPLFYVIDAKNGQIVDSTYVRYEKEQQGLKLLPK